MSEFMVMIVLNVLVFGVSMFLEKSFSCFVFVMGGRLVWVCLIIWLERFMLMILVLW